MDSITMSYSVCQSVIVNPSLKTIFFEVSYLTQIEVKISLWNCYTIISSNESFSLFENSLWLINYET